MAGLFTAPHGAAVKKTSFKSSSGPELPGFVWACCRSADQAQLVVEADAIEKAATECTA